MKTRKMKVLFSALLFFTALLALGNIQAADQRIQYNEEMVGASHPTKTDTLNRHSLVEHNTAGEHTVDHIAEKTVGHGVNIDGVTLKDGGATVLTGGVNTFNVTNGTASLDVAAGAAVNIDNGLTVNGGNAGTLTFNAASKALTVTDNATLDEAVALSSKAPKESPTFTGTATIPIVQNSQVDMVLNAGANTVAAISGGNSHWIVIAHDKNDVSHYAMAFIVVSDGNTSMSVVNLSKAGSFATTGFSASTMNLQVTNDEVALNGRISLLRIR